MIDGRLIRATLNISNGCPYFGAARKYLLARINLVKAGCPQEIVQDSKYARLMESPQVPVVIEKNRARYGYVQATGYTPPAIVVAGLKQRADVLAQGGVRGWSWVENGSMEIRADDAISAEELMAKLANLLNDKYTRGLQNVAQQPWICHLYPFENYVVFSLHGQKYKQAYSLDPVGRTVSLTGQPVAVKEQYINATKERDLLHHLVHHWSNLSEALTMYLSDVSKGLMTVLNPKGIATPDTRDQITLLMAKRDVSFPDFARWSAREQNDLSYKAINGSRICREHFRYSDLHDKSTWVLRRCG